MKIEEIKPQMRVEACSASDQLLRHVWNHMHGQNMDGSRRKFPDDDACGRNWKKLSDAIGEYLHEQDDTSQAGYRCQLCGMSRASNWFIYEVAKSSGNWVTPCCGECARKYESRGPVHQ